MAPVTPRKRPANIGGHLHAAQANDGADVTQSRGNAIFTIIGGAADRHPARVEPA